MKKLLLMPFMLVLGFLGVASNSNAQDTPVEYERICSLYGAGFHYIPGTDVCVNERTGETREQTAGGTWTSVLPTSSQGHWTTVPVLECGLGRLVKVGTYKPSDFTENAYTKFQTPPFPFTPGPGEFISKFMISGGFYDPLQPKRHSPSLDVGQGQFCVRTADPSFTITDMGSGPYTPTFCSSAPLGCVSNSQILGTPAAFSFSVLGTPPVAYNTDTNGVPVGTPKTCGSQIIVTTGMGRYDPTQTGDESLAPGTTVPTAGSLSVWACVERSIAVQSSQP